MPGQGGPVLWVRKVLWVLEGTGERRQRLNSSKEVQGGPLAKEQEREAESKEIRGPQRDCRGRGSVVTDEEGREHRSWGTWRHLCTLTFYLWTPERHWCN